jgi:TetR/AcrR family transcriptional repressor of nem operon
MTFDSDEAVVSAMNVFWQRGYAGTTPQALLDELGIGKGSFYNTFESKRNVFTLALERYRDNRLRSVGELLRSAASVRTGIRQSLVELTGLDSHRLGCMMVNSIAELSRVDANVDVVAESLFDGIERLFQEAIVRGQATGELAADGDAEERANSLVVTMIGSSILLKMGSDLSRVERAIAEAVRAL